MLAGLLLAAGAIAMEVTAMDVDELIEQLGLEAHEEGGYFRRTFEAGHRDKIDTEHGPRFTLTSIYYLLTRESPTGHWHLNRSDILHFFHLGSPVTYYLIHPSGELETVVMGPDPAQGHLLQLAVRGGTWKASQLPEGEYGLVSEAVAPGFEYEDMELGDREILLGKYPQHRAVIEAWSRR